MLYAVAMDQVTSSEPDPDVPRRLVVAYAHGDGIQQDPLAACAFARLYQAAARLRYHRYPDDSSDS